MACMLVSASITGVWLTVASISVKNTYGPLGQHILDVSRAQGLDADRLKSQLGVSTDLFNHLLYYGIKPNARQPKPGILRRVARLLSIDERKLFFLAGYDAFRTRGTITVEIQASTLGEYLERALQQRSMSGNELSELAGISQGTVRNLLKQGDTASVPGPHPKKLKAVCEVLNLDQVRAFQLAGYISPDDTDVFQAEDEHSQSIIDLFAMLSPDKQATTLAQLTELLLTREGSNTI